VAYLQAKMSGGGWPGQAGSRPLEEAGV
jgi:hypothetical protein